jgi:hypothetical protein
MHKMEFSFGYTYLGQRDWAHVNAILHVKNSVLPSTAMSVNMSAN